MNYGKYDNQSEYIICFCHITGQYGVHIKWNDEHIPNSPFKVTVSPDGGSARQVTIHAFKDRGLAVSLLIIILNVCIQINHRSFCGLLYSK